jgi:hypothetical protein
MASEFIASMRHSPIDELDTLVDAMDALEHEPSADVGLAAASLARRYLRNIGDLSDTERANLSAAVLAEPNEACSLALTGFVSLWLRVRKRTPDV